MKPYHFKGISLPFVKEDLPFPLFLQQLPTSELNEHGLMK